MRNIAAAFFLCLFIILTIPMSGCRNDSDRLSPKFSPFAVADKPALLDTIPDNLVPRSSGAIRKAAQSPKQAGIYNAYFAPNGRGVAYTVVIDGEIYYVVHNGKQGKLYAGVNEPVFSADGIRFAYVAKDGEKYRVVMNGVEGELFDDVQPPVFSSDGRHLAYIAKRGGRWHLVVNGRLDRGTNDYYNGLQFSADSKRIIYTIDPAKNSGQGAILIVSDLDYANTRTLDRSVISYFLTDDHKTIASVVKTDSGLHRVRLFNFDSSEPVWQSSDYNKVESFAFSTNGKELFFVADRQGSIYGVSREMEHVLEKRYSTEQFAINSADHSVVMLMREGASILQYRLKNSLDRISEACDEVESLTVSSGGATAFVALRGGRYYIVTNGKEGPAFDRVVKPKFSPDGKYLVYRARQEGKRFVVVADAAGKVLRQHPPYEHVYDVTFTADGRSVAYGVKEGNTFAWKVEPL